MTCSVFRGAVNAEIFEEFIEFNVLPYCNAFPGPKSVIVLDNAGIHIPEVRKYLEIGNDAIFRIYKRWCTKKAANSNSCPRTLQISIPSNILSL